jgi:hypothetical protein
MFWWMVVALSLAVGVVFFAGIEWMRDWYPLDTPQDFGAAASVLGALFSAFAFVGIIATIVLQGRELALQREELAETREVLEGQQEQLHAQSEVMARDAFERSLFGLLELKRALVRDLDDRQADDRSVTDHRSTLARAAAGLRASLKQVSGEHAKPEDVLASIERAFHAQCYQPQHHFGPYLRVTYHILEFIDRATLPETDKRNYSRLYRAQFSPDEMLVLLCNCSLSKWADFRMLAVKYKLFKGTMWATEVGPYLDLLLHSEEQGGDERPPS